jgi:hypothetical protein
MHFSIVLSPEIAKRVEDAARSRGVDSSKLIELLVVEGLSKSQQLAGGVSKDHIFFTASAEEFSAALDDLSDENVHLPVLPDEAFDRGNTY